MRPKSAAAVLKQSNTPAFLVTDLTNIKYLSGVSMSAGCMLITPRKFVLFADGRYTEAATKTAYQFVVVKPAETLAKSISSYETCGCESKAVTLAQFGMWKRKFKNTKFVQKEGIIEEFRRSKAPDELRKFRRAQKITQEMIRRVPRALKEGESEKAIAEKLRSWALGYGAEDLSFEPIVAFGTHSSMGHHRASGRTLRKGNVVQIDIGAKYQGYCADQSAVFFTASPTKKQERAYKAVEEAKSAAIALVRPGVSTHELDEAARKVLRSYGLENAFTHALGHGVGLNVHEGVTLSKRAPEEILLKGEIITIEPGVYFPGQFGIRLEEEVVVC
jgi:Xaa-Pro aminopeptidase